MIDSCVSQGSFYCIPLKQLGQLRKPLRFPELFNGEALCGHFRKNGRKWFSKNLRLIFAHWNEPLCYVHVLRMQRVWHQQAASVSSVPSSPKKS